MLKKESSLCHGPAVGTKANRFLQCASSSGTQFNMGGRCRQECQQTASSRDLWDGTVRIDPSQSMLKSKAQMWSWMSASNPVCIVCAWFQLFQDWLCVLDFEFPKVGFDFPRVIACAWCWFLWGWCVRLFYVFGLVVHAWFWFSKNDCALDFNFLKVDCAFDFNLQDY